MRLIFVNRYFWPDESATSQLLGDVAFSLAEQPADVQVHVITSRMHYAQAAAALAGKQTERGVRITRIWTSRFGRANLVGRAVDYATFYISAAWRLFQLAQPGDIVVVKTDPPLLSIVLAPVARWRRAHLVNWLQDIYPEVATVLGMRAASLPMLHRLRNRSLARAAANVVLGEVMAGRVEALGAPRERIVAVPNWADGRLVVPVAREINTLRRAWGLEGKFVVAYSGNLGRAHDRETMLGAIAEVERQGLGNISWIFIGGGAQFQALQREVAERALQSVHFRPYQPRETLAESLGVGDVHLVSLRPELEGLIVPSKIYGILAAGRPAIFLGAQDGELARLIATEQCGATIGQGDAAGLARLVAAWAADRPLVERMGANARSALAARYDLPHAIARWRRLIADVRQRGRSPGP